MTTPNIDLGRFGVFTWDPGSSFLDLGLAVTPGQAQEIERLGYRTLWVTGSPAADLSFAEPLLKSTTALNVATGIVNIWTADAKTVAESFHRINTAYPGRFVLGIGAGHPEHTEQYRKPYDALVDYLDELDEYGVPANQRVLAALGPRVLRLAAQRTAGAHPYNTTPEHSAQAREIIGPNAVLAPEHKVLAIADAEEGRAVGRKMLNRYLNLANYVNNFKRLGFTDADLTPPGSDKFIDALVAYGSPDDIADRLREHLRAGADHVVIHVLGGSDQLLPTLTELAGALGLTTRRNQPANRQRLGIGETHDNNRRIGSGDTGTVRTASPRGDYRSRC
jgi:probable F420-dependent oxidoreductase